eukprot:11588561-Karenia_brevis.AAC.1
MVAQFDRVTIRHGHIKAYCDVAHVSQVTQQLVAQSCKAEHFETDKIDTGVGDLALKAQHLVAAHFHDKKIPNLKDAIYWIRKTGGDKTLIKQLDALNTTHSFLKHWSPGLSAEILDNIKGALIGAPPGDFKTPFVASTADPWFSGAGDPWCPNPDAATFVPGSLADTDQTAIPSKTLGFVPSDAGQQFPDPNLKKIDVSQEASIENIQDMISSSV